jgi:uncharacterized membrane protein affecting hemolysin expression
MDELKKLRIYKIILFVLISLIIIALLIYLVPKYNLIQYNKGYSDGGRDLIIQQTQNLICLVTNGTDIIPIQIK